MTKSFTRIFSLIPFRNTYTVLDLWPLGFHWSWFTFYIAHYWWLDVCLSFIIILFWYFHSQYQYFWHEHDHLGSLGLCDVTSCNEASNVTSCYGDIFFGKKLNARVIYHFINKIFHHFQMRSIDLKSGHKVTIY